MSLTLPPETPVTWVEDLADGLPRHPGPRRRRVLGGGRGPRPRPEISVTVAILGTLDGREPCSGPGPARRILALAGTAGHAAAGLALLESGKALNFTRGAANHPRHAMQAAAAAGSRAGPAAGRCHGDAGHIGWTGPGRLRLAAASGAALDLDPAR